MGKRKQSAASWRKRGAPLEDAALHVRRQANQERRTGGSVAKLNDAQLFALDVKAGGTKPVGLGHRRVPRPAKRLWVDEVIAPNKHIPLAVKPAVASEKPDAPSRGTLLVRDKLGKVRKAASRTLVHRAARSAVLALAGPAPPPPDALDIWGGAIEKQHVPRVGRRGPKRLAPEQSTHQAAVDLPVEGASWNPTFDAHQQLLASATAHELARQQREKAHRMPDLFAPGPWEVEEGEEGAERGDEEGEKAGEDMEEGEEEGEEEEEEDDDDEEHGVTWHRERKPITSTQRNKQAQAKVRVSAAAAKAAQRKREKQLGRVGAISKELSREERERNKRRAAEEAHEAARVKKLGPSRHVASRPDVLLSDEQAGAMRQIVGEGSLMEDRFESMRARHLVEARERRPNPAKRKMRQVNRESAKDTKYKSPHGFPGPVPAWL